MLGLCYILCYGMQEQHNYIVYNCIMIVGYFSTNRGPRDSITYYAYCIKVVDRPCVVIMVIIITG